MFLNLQSRFFVTFLVMIGMATGMQDCLKCFLKASHHFKFPNDSDASAECTLYFHNGSDKEVIFHKSKSPVRHPRYSSGTPGYPKLDACTAKDEGNYTWICNGQKQHFCLELYKATTELSTSTNVERSTTIHGSGGKASKFNLIFLLFVLLLQFSMQLMLCIN